MAIVQDASTPAVVSGSTAWTTNKTTSAFSPPANALLVIAVAGDGTGSGATTAVISDSLAGTWTLLKRENDFSLTAPGIGGTAELWYKFQSAAQTNMTVSFHAAGSAANGYLGQVFVLTGAASTQAGVVGGTFRNNGTGAALQVAITPGAAGNIVLGAAVNWTSSTVPTVLANTANQSSLSDATNGDAYMALKSASTTTTSSTTYGYSTSLAEWLIAVVEIQASGGSNFTANPADPLGLTDSVTAVQDFVRAPADPLGLTDTPTAAQDFVRSQADPEGITDAAIPSQGFTRTPADPEGITDSATTSQGFNRTAADPEGLTDSAATNTDMPRGPSDPSGITDTITATQDFVRLPADPVGLTDTVTVTTTYVRVAADALGMTDGVTAQITTGGTVTPADQLGMVDALTVTVDYSRNTADPLGATDTVTVAQDNQRGTNDPTGITDIVTTALGMSRALADAVGMTDQVSAVITTGSAGSNITVTASLDVRRWAATLDTRNKLGALTTRQWSATLDAIGVRGTLNDRRWKGSLDD